MIRAEVYLTINSMLCEVWQVAKVQINDVHYTHSLSLLRELYGYGNMPHDKNAVCS